MIDHQFHFSAYEAPKSLSALRDRAISLDRTGLLSLDPSGVTSLGFQQFESTMDGSAIELTLTLELQKPLPSDVRNIARIVLAHETSANFNQSSQREGFEYFSTTRNSLSITKTFFGIDLKEANEGKLSLVIMPRYAELFSEVKWQLRRFPRWRAETDLDRIGNGRQVPLEPGGHMFRWDARIPEPVNIIVQLINISEHETPVLTRVASISGQGLQTASIMIPPKSSGQCVIASRHAMESGSAFLDSRSSPDVYFEVRRFPFLSRSKAAIGKPLALWQDDERTSWSTGFQEMPECPILLDLTCDAPEPVERHFLVEVEPMRPEITYPYETYQKFLTLVPGRNLLPISLDTMLPIDSPLRSARDPKNIWRMALRRLVNNDITIKNVSLTPLTGPQLDENMWDCLLSGNQKQGPLVVK